jgi:hypothetical protein
MREVTPAKLFRIGGGSLAFAAAPGAPGAADALETL